MATGICDSSVNLRPSPGLETSCAVGITVKAGSAGPVDTDNCRRRMRIVQGSTGRRRADAALLSVRSRQSRFVGRAGRSGLCSSRPAVRSRVVVAAMPQGRGGPRRESRVAATSCRGFGSSAIVRRRRDDRARSDARRRIETRFEVHDGDIPLPADAALVFDADGVRPTSSRTWSR